MKLSRDVERRIAREEELLRQYCHPVPELYDGDLPLDDDPRAYLHGELERCLDRVRQRTLAADHEELVVLVVADLIATGYLDEEGARNADLHRCLDEDLAHVIGNNQDIPQ
jgi:hypothetical protein